MRRVNLKLDGKNHTGLQITCIMPTRAAPPAPESRPPAQSIGLCQAYSAVTMNLLLSLTDFSLAIHGVLQAQSRLLDGKSSSLL